MAKNLADGQGGCDDSHSITAQGAPQGVNLEQFLEKGEKFLRTLSDKVLVLEQLSTSVSDLQSDFNTLKRGSCNEGLNEPGPSKKKIRQGVSASEHCNDEGDDDDSSGIDEFLSAVKNAESASDADSFLDYLETFCIESLATGDAIPEKLCRIVNKSLRNTPDQEKLKQLQEKYKRPANVENVQIPKIGGFLWDQLKTSTKSMDFRRQKTIGELNLVLLPVTQTLIHLSEDSPEISQVKECVGDAFKLICHGVTSTNQQRRDTIKKELFPKFTAICGMDHPASATKLFGDNLADESKQLDTSKSIKMTAKSQHHVLAQREGLMNSQQKTVAGPSLNKMHSRGRNPSRRFSNRGRFGRHQRRSVGNRNSGAWANY